MPYAPGISYDWSPIMQGMSAYTGAVSRGREIAGRAIGQGMASIGQSVSEGFDAMRKKKEEIDLLSGQADAMAGRGDMTEEDFLAFQDAPIGRKRAMVSEGLAARSLKQKEDMAVMEHMMRLDEISARTKAEGAGWAPTVMDLGDKDPALKGVKVISTSRGGGQILDTRGGSGVTFQEDPTTGARFAVTGKGSVHPITSGAIPKPDAMTTAVLAGYKAQIAKSEQTIADAQSEIAKGNQKKGWDKWPWSTPFDQVILEEQAKIQVRKQQMGTMLQGTRGQGGGAGAAPSPAIQDTPEAIREQYRAKTISRDEANRRLKALGFE